MGVIALPRPGGVTHGGGGAVLSLAGWWVRPSRVTGCSGVCIAVDMRPYHEGLGERVKGAGTLLHESSAQEGQRSLIDRLLKGKARSEVVGQMKGLQASLASIDQGRLDRLHSESQEQLHVYFGLLERILKSVEGSD